MGRPERGEVASYYLDYIERVEGDDVMSEMEAQLDETLALLERISEDRSLFRYAPDKWSIRQVLSHVNDTERVFAFRAFWFAREFDSPLPSFDEKACAESALADQVPWATHIEEFRAIRLATLSLFRNLPGAAWMRSGTASGNPFTVRAIAFIVVGHVAHHLAVLRERYA